MNDEKVEVVGDEVIEDPSPAPPYVRTFCSVSVRAVNKEQREILHLITTGSTDRAGDVVDPGGAVVEQYLRNPIVMVNHSYDYPRDVVGKAINLQITDKGISARTKFYDTPLARDAFMLAADGVGGYSIGFRPLKTKHIRDEDGRLTGFRFKQWELLEYSLVAIPMNPDVVNGLVRRGFQNVERFFVGGDARTVEETASSGTNADVDRPFHRASDEEREARRLKAEKVARMVADLVAESDPATRAMRDARRRKAKELAASLGEFIDRHEAGQRVADLVRGL